MTNRRALLASGLAFAASAVSAQSTNFLDRVGHILSVCPHVELQKLAFGNEDRDRRTRFVTNLSWKNIGNKPLISFEIVLLKYDAFDQRLIGTRWTVEGKNSVDWRALAPGDIGSDGVIAYGSESVFTMIAYVRNARLGDGTVWHASDADVGAALRRVAPGIKEPGSLRPDPKPTKSE